MLSTFAILLVLGLVGGGLLLVALGIARWVFALDSTRCPGRREAWWRWLTMIALVHRPICGYDLAGLGRPVHRTQLRRLTLPVTCPECGRVVRRRRDLVGKHGPWRPIPFGCLAMAAGFFLFWRPPVQSSTILALAPSEVLLRGAEFLGTATPIEIREEIERRSLALDLDTAQSRRAIELLLADLRDDNIPGNGARAIDRLSAIAFQDIQPVIDALRSPDAQQRRLAAKVFWRLSLSGRLPTALIDATLDAFLAPVSTRETVDGAARVLTEHLPEVLTRLVEAVEQGPEAGRRRAIQLLAETGNLPLIDSGRLEVLAASLLEGLHSSEPPDDAREAVRTLLRIGPRAVHAALPFLRSPDDRQRRLAAEVCWSQSEWPELPPELLDATIDALGDDDRRFNERSAQSFLSAHFAEVQHALFKRLVAAQEHDPQRQQLLRELLRRPERDPQFTPELVRDAVDDLRTWRGEGHRGIAFRFLIDAAGSTHAPAAVDAAFREGMLDSHPFVRLLVAGATGCAGRVSSIDDAVPILVDHLIDNSLPGDAIIAARALYGFGRPVVERLAPYRLPVTPQSLDPFGRSRDEQQRQLAEYIARRLTTDDSVLRLTCELPLIRVTEKGPDLTTIDPRHIDMPWARLWEETAPRPSRAHRR